MSDLIKAYTDELNKVQEEIEDMWSMLSVVQQKNKISSALKSGNFMIEKLH